MQTMKLELMTSGLFPFSAKKPVLATSAPAATSPAALGATTTSNAATASAPAAESASAAAPPTSISKPSEYYNVVDFSPDGAGVLVDDLWEYVCKKKAEGGFKAEYDVSSQILLPHLP